MLCPLEILRIKTKIPGNSTRFFSWSPMEIPFCFYELSRIPVPIPTKQNFIIGCWYFLKKHKLPVQNKTLLFVTSIFRFRTPPYCYWWLIMKKCGWKLYRSPNPNPRGVRKCNSTYFSYWYLLVSLWRCSVLNPKSKRGVTHFLVWWGITISPTCMHMSVRIFEWMVRSLD